MSRCVLGTVALVVLASGVAEPARGWGMDGHRIVCAVAYGLLAPELQGEVDRLVASYRRPDGRVHESFAEGCLFADDARIEARNRTPGWSYFRRFDSWHFLNLPRDAAHVEATHCGGNCVLEGVRVHSRRLGDLQLPDWKRGQALLMLGHWIGDVHQPLHVSFEDDLGGNDVKPIRGGLYFPYWSRKGHLHGVWDSGILRVSMNGDDWQEYAERLLGEIDASDSTEWLAGEPLGWAEESYAVAISPDADYCAWEDDDDGRWCSPEAHVRRLRAEYQELFGGVVDLRLEQAGTRLAAAIREELE